MIIKEDLVRVDKVKLENCINIGIEENDEIYKNSIFFDLEHYVYKKPICIGVFGCSYYDELQDCIKVTQYMIENKSDSIEILYLARDYFINMEGKGKKYIVTFSGNNDFTMINYLFEKYSIDYKVTEHYIGIDLQKKYEEAKKSPIGLKALEKTFNIARDSELISGQNLAKTFSKIMKDEEYIDRMPSEKKEKILLYNEQDVVSLFDILVNWNSVL